MTKKEKARRQALVNTLKIGLHHAGFFCDRWNNYKNEVGKTRVKFKSNVIRLEHKSFGNWYRIASFPYHKLSEENVQMFIEKAVRHSS